MTFARPTLEALVTRTEAELATRLGLGPLHRRSVLAVLARVAAGLSHSAHGHLDYVADQVFPQTASAESLERHASLRGLARKAATFATGLVTFSGSAGSSVPTGARLTRTDGRVYELLAAATIGAGGTGSGTVEAVLPGAAANAVIGTALVLQSAAAGVAATATAGELAGGADQETDEDLRARVLASWRSRPMAGTAEDYVRWALEVPGITRAWCVPGWPTLGQVTVQVVADGNSPTIAPTGAQLSEVQGHIDELRPVTARASVVAPALAPLDLTLSVSPSTPALRSAVESAIEDLLAREAVPGGTIYLSAIAEAISTTPGESHHRIESPTADAVAAPGTLWTMGDVTWA